VGATEPGSEAAPAWACENPHDYLRWYFDDGELADVRCSRSNRCFYCAYLAGAENMTVVYIDAKDEAPVAGMTLTTRNPDFDMVRFRRAMGVLFDWLRRRFGRELAYLALMEWTTGSGGHGRLPHTHILLKRLPMERVDFGYCERPEGSQRCSIHLWCMVKTRWEALTGAWMVECRPLHSAGGAVAYMVGHHHKYEQRPPENWSGKRFRPSKNYFVTPIAELREQARADRRRSIAIAQLAREYGTALERMDVDALVAAALERTPTLVDIRSLKYARMVAG
jgi:hypothetical protein